jgi:hypothetical protein
MLHVLFFMKLAPSHYCGYRRDHWPFKRDCDFGGKFRKQGSAFVKTCPDITLVERKGTQNKVNKRKSDAPMCEKLIF